MATTLYRRPTTSAPPNPTSPVTSSVSHVSGAAVTPVGLSQLAASALPPIPPGGLYKPAPPVGGTTPPAPGGGGGHTTLPVGPPGSTGGAGGGTGGGATSPVGTTTTTTPASPGTDDPWSALESLFGAGSTANTPQAVVGLPTQQNVPTGGAGGNYTVLGLVFVGIVVGGLWLWKSGKLDFLFKGKAKGKKK